MSRCPLQDAPLFRPARSVVFSKMSRCVGRYISSSSPRCPFDVADTSRCLRLRVPAPPPDSIIIYYLSFIISHPKRPVISSKCPFSTSVDLNQGRNDEKVGRIFTFSCFFFANSPFLPTFAPCFPQKEDVARHNIGSIAFRFWTSIKEILHVLSFLYKI